MGDLEPRVNVPFLLAKSLIASIPLVGPAAADLLWEVLPNRRMERVEEMLAQLSSRVEDMDDATVRRKMMEPVFVDLLDEGARQATRAPSSERLQEIAAVLESGLRQGDASKVDHKFILSLLGELNDVEIVLLAAKGKSSRDGVRAFHEKHAEVLDRVPPTFGSSRDVLDKEALRLGMESHLERLGLLEVDIRSPHLGSRQRRQLTGLGRLLLRTIGQPAELDETS